MRAPRRGFAILEPEESSDVQVLDPESEVIELADEVVKKAEDVKLIVFACEAGMGSSLMGAKQLQKMVKKSKLDIEVIHSPVNAVPAHVDVIVTHRSLAKSARSQFPDAAIVPFQLFFGDPAVQTLVQTLKDGNDVVSTV